MNSYKVTLESLETDAENTADAAINLRDRLVDPPTHPVVFIVKDLRTGLTERIELVLD